jgi:hypothetical protein
MQREPAVAGTWPCPLFGTSPIDTKIESTVRYLGIDVGDALTIAEQVDV